MGKLAEALRKRQQAIEDHKNQPRKPFAEDPAAGQEFFRKWIELEHLRKKANELLAGAFSGLTKEQRQQYFDQALNEKTRDQFGFRGFQAAISKAANQEEPIKALTEVFSDRGSFGIPLEQLYSGLESMLSEDQRKAIDKQLGGRRAPAERAARIFVLLGQPVDQVYQNMVSEEKKREYCSATLELFVRESRIDGVLTRNSYYKDGRSWIDSVEELETILGEEKSSRLAEQIDSLVPLRLSPNKIIRPQAERIEELRSGIDPTDPQAAEKQNLLNRASELLVYPAPDYLEQLEAMDSKKLGGQQGPGAAASGLLYGAVKEYLDGIGDGSFPKKLPHLYSNYTEMDQYSPLDVQPSQLRGRNLVGVDLTEEEQEQLRQSGRGGADPKTREAVLSILRDIEAMGEKNYWLDEVVEVREGTLKNPIKVEYKGEQGQKNYAFWPVVTAKNAVREALAEGNWDKLRAAEAEYARRKAIADRMMETSQKATDQPYNPGNLNSTRPHADGSLNEVPTEYLEDFAGHSRVNGIFVLYATVKNTGVPAERLLDDPAGVLQETAKDFIQTRLLSSCREKPLGAQLAFGFNQKRHSAAQMDFSNKMTTFFRGLDAITCMMPDRDAFVKSSGKHFCAAASACYEVGKELVPWRALSEADEEQKQLVTELAMILPEEEFDLKDVGLKLGREDWRQTLDPARELARLEREGRLNYEQIMERASRIAADAAQAEDPVHNDFKPKDNRAIYRKALRNTYDRLLKLAPPEKREALQNAYLKGELKNDPALKEASTGLDRQISTLSREKNGLFLRKKNSPEHEVMMRRLKLVRRKLDDLSGDPKALDGVRTDIAERFRKKSLREFLTDARKACYHYAFEKTKGGTYTILHEAGMERKAAAMNSLRLLGEMEDRLGLRSPAMRLLDAVCETALDGRGKKAWVRENCEKHAAMAIVALSMEHQNVPPEKQAEQLKPEKLDSAVKRILKQPAFRQMVRNEGLAGLADKLVQGSGALTDAYMKATRQVEDPQARGEAPKTTPEQKKAFWANRENPVQELGAGK